MARSRAGWALRPLGVLVMALRLAGCVGVDDTPIGSAMTRPANAAACLSPFARVEKPASPSLASSGGSIEGWVGLGLYTRLDAVFAEAYKATGARAMTAAIGLPEQGMRTDRRGSDRRLFYWASVGKQAIAVVILQLAQEGRLRLSDPVSRWIQHVPNGDQITIEHLLAHTSGLFSANEHPSFSPGGRRLSDDGELALLHLAGPLFAPGACWSYSNSGYNLLARIITQADRRPWAASIEARIIRRLGLKDMRVVANDAPLSDVAQPVAPAGEVALSISAPGAAGALVASAVDMIRFHQAILDGRLLKADGRAALLRNPQPTFQAGIFYGLGMMLYDVPDQPRRVHWIGHSGGGPGVRAVVAYDLDRRAFVAVALIGPGDAHAAANRLLKALDP